MNRSLRNTVLAVLLVCLASAAFAADERHALTRALDYDTNLLLVLDLQLDQRQLGTLAAALATAGRMVAASDRNGAAAGPGGDLVQQEFQALAEGRQLTQQQQAALEQLRVADRQQRGRMYAAVDAQIKRFRRALSPQQAALVDWTAPPEVPAVPDESGALEQLRDLAAKLDHARGFLDRMRYVIPTLYIQTRQGRIDEFLRDYYRPDTEAFLAARDCTIKLVDDARMVNEEQWPQQAPAFASELLQRVGALEAEAEMAGPNNRARYNWWDLYYLLTDPQSPYMLQAMTGVAAPANGNANDNGQNNNNDNGGDDAE
jgi:hypothetical protein